jgi:hypothetical protein
VRESNAGFGELFFYDARLYAFLGRDLMSLGLVIEKVVYSLGGIGVMVVSC